MSTGRKRSLSGPACSSPTKRKKYLCKYLKAWETEFSWLSHSDRSVNDAIFVNHIYLLDPVQGMQSHKTICSWRWFKGNQNQCFCL